MTFGDTELARGDSGEHVTELQIRLAGFRGTVPDGSFGPGTELQVITFQRDFMRIPEPSGVADAATLAAIDRLATLHPIDFAKLRCPCGECGGFGQGRFRRHYHSGGPKSEATYRYEYPGVHRMLLWAVRGLFFYAKLDFVITSGYRCAERNRQTGRSSTNHHGKAIDLDVPGKPGEDRRDDMARCDRIRGICVEKSNAQIGWLAPNRKALEPASIAPTWVHYDVRCYDRDYLADSFFCTTEAELDGGHTPAAAPWQPAAAMEPASPLTEQPAGS
jgi:hypothetical protein